MKRRDVATAALAGSALLALPALHAQQPRVLHVGTLGSVDGTTWVAFRDELRRRGYVEGRNLDLVQRWSGGFGDRLPSLAAELVRHRVDIIAASGTQATAAAMQASSTIPIVMTVSSYPERVGLVQSLARPGGNVTGLSNIAPQLQGKRLELMKEVVVGLRRMACLWNPDAPVEVIAREAIEAAANDAGVTMQFAAARSPRELPTAMASARTGGAEAMLAIGNPVNFAGRDAIVRYALENRWPTVFDERSFVEAGGLLSYAPSFDDLFRRAAIYVDRIAKGARPADLPVEQPTKLELFINLKTAQVLGLTIPQSVLLRADHVIA